MRHVHRTAWWVLLPTLGLFSARPAPGGEFRGRLLVGEKPTAGVAVSVTPYEAPLEVARREARGGPPPKPFASVTTAPDGSFVLAVAAEPPRSFVVRVSGGGVRPVEFDGVFDSSETTDLGEHALAAGEALSGKVVDRAGQPIVGAMVTLLARTPGDAEFVAAPASTTTGADGTFRLEGAAAGQGLNALRIEKPGYAVVSETFSRAGVLPKSIVLSSGTVLPGRVKPLPEKSAAGTLVRLEGRAETRWVEAAPDGSFTIPDAPPGRQNLVADAGEAGFGEVTGLLLPLPEGKTATVALAPPASLAGRVVDAKTLRGIPRAKVEIREGTRSRTVRSGPDGSYAIAPLPPRTALLLVDEPRYVPFRKNLEITPGGATRVDAPLVLGASIAGRVVDESGHPVSGAEGMLVRAPRTGLAAFLRQVRTGGGSPIFRTGADGTFRAARLAPGTNQELSVGHPEFSTATVGGLTLVGGETAANVAVVLRKGAVIAGLVHDKDGKPVEGAEAEVQQELGFRGGRGAVVLRAITGRAGGLRRPPVRTGADGRFEIRGLPSGDYTLWVRKSGFATERIDPVKVPETGSPEAVSVTLGPGAAISGTVVLRSGAPVEGWSVVASEPGTAAFGPRGRGNLNPTGSDGLFILEGLKPGQPYDLSLFGGSGVGPSRKGVVPPAAGLEIVVPGTGRITGRAVDAGTAEPIKEYSVSYEPERARGGGAFRMVNRAAGRQVTGMGVRHEVRAEDGSFVLDDVPAGTWSVVVEAKGYQPARAGNVVVEEGGTAADVEVKVSAGGELRGRVLDALSGEPVPNAAVTHSTGGTSGGPLAALAATSDEEVTTDADGSFVVGGLAPGKVSLTVTHPDYSDAHQTVDVKEGATTAEIRMTPGSAIAGLVLSDAQQPVPGAEVVLQSAGDAGFGRAMMGGGSSAVTDSAGRFRFDHLTAGRYSLSASLQSQTSATQTIVLSDGQSRDDAVIQIARGATLQGVVSGVPDSMKVGMTVTASGENSYSGSTKTAADGTFQFTGVPVGTVTLRATTGSLVTSSQSATKQLEMPEGQPVVQTEIIFDPGYALSGRVTRAGQPLAGVTVVANLIGGGGRQASSQTDDGGVYQMQGLTGGTYNVMAMATVLGGSMRSQQVTVSGDQTLDIAFPSAKLGGTVVDAQGNAPLPDAQVQVTPSDPNASGSGGRLMRTATSDSNGSFLITDLDPQSYDVNVQKTDYLVEQRSITAAEQGTDALTIPLTRGEGIAVVGRDGVFGVPLHGLTVRVTDSTHSPVYSGSITLDGSGIGEIPSLKPGSYTLTASASGYAVTTIPGINVPCPPVTVSLTPGGSAEIHSGPKTLPPGTTVRAQVLTSAGSPYPLGLFSPDGTIAISAAVRRIDNLAPGSYVLAVAGGAQQSFSVQEGGLTVVQLP